MLGEEGFGGGPASCSKPLSAQQPAKSSHKRLVVIQDKYGWFFVHCRKVHFASDGRLLLTLKRCHDYATRSTRLAIPMEISILLRSRSSDKRHRSAPLTNKSQPP